MPNWTTNKVSIIAPDKTTMEKFLNAGVPNPNPENGKYSFESWIPMPETFRKYDTTNHPNGKNLVVGNTASCWDKNSPVVTNELIEEYKNATAYQEKTYGVVGWYDYGLKYWGVKWNANFDLKRVSDTQVETARAFDTAWTTPLSFFKTIAKQYSLTIKIWAHFEDCYNCLFVINDPDKGDYDESLDYSSMLAEFNKLIDDENLSEKENEAIKRMAAETFFPNDWWNCAQDVYYNYCVFMSIIFDRPDCNQ